MKHTGKLIKRGGVAALVVLLAACSQQSQKQYAECGLSDSNNVDHLFAEVSENLENMSRRKVG